MRVIKHWISPCNASVTSELSASCWRLARVISTEDGKPVKRHFSNTMTLTLQAGNTA